MKKLLGSIIVALALLFIAAPAHAGDFQANAQYGTRYIPMSVPPNNCTTGRDCVYISSADGNLYHKKADGSVVNLSAPSAGSTGLYNCKAYGVVGGGVIDDTSAIQACLDAAGVAKSTAYLPSGTYLYSNLKMYAYSTLRGNGMGQQTILKRKPGSTGTGLRERTSGEGNPSGASGLWLRDLYFDGNATTGDGINLGNQVPAVQLNFNSGVENVFVYNFTSGVGLILNQNAAKCSYVWSNSNATGIQTQGGGGYYDGIWAEGNTSINLQVQSSDDTFVHVHAEQAGTSAPATGLVKIEGSQNRFFGTSLVQTSNITQGVFLANGAVRNEFYGTMLNTNGFTFSNVIYVNAWGFGTGSTDFLIPQFVDSAGGLSVYYYNQSDNSRTVISGSVLKSVSLDTPFANALTLGGATATSIAAGYNAMTSFTAKAKNITLTGTDTANVNTPVVTDTLNAYTGSAAIVSFRNATVQKAAIDATGKYYGLGLDTLSATALTLGGTATTVDLASSIATINFSTAFASSIPTFTTRSGGQKITLYPAISGSTTDYAIGVDNATNFSQWYGVPTTSYKFQWYGGTTLAAVLTGDGTLTNVGGRVVRVRTVSDVNATAATNDYIIAESTMTAGRTVTLPGAAPAGTEYIIKNQSSGAFAITITPTSGTCDGAASCATTAAARAPAVRVYSDGTNYYTW